MDKLLKQLRQHFSEKRILPYEKLAQVKNTDAVSLYKLNVLLCEELYSFISCIKVCLRNNIHKKMTDVLNKEDWYMDICRGEKHRNQLDIAIENARKQKCKNFVCDDVICAVSFGFWCHMFDNYYEPILWAIGSRRRR